MQLWLWANVKIGHKGCGFAGNVGAKSEVVDTNIVVMKPDMAVDPDDSVLIERRCRAWDLEHIPMVSWAILRGMEWTNLKSRASRTSGEKKW